jgi:hypothetical protein
MTPARRKLFLKPADKELVQSICECALNTLKGNVPLKPCQKKTLSRYKRILRKLVHPKGGWKSKRKILIQHGGAFFPALLAPILASLLTSLIT